MLLLQHIIADYCPLFIYISVEKTCMRENKVGDTVWTKMQTRTTTMTMLQWKHAEHVYTRQQTYTERLQTDTERDRNIRPCMQKIPRQFERLTEKRTGQTENQTIGHSPRSLRFEDKMVLDKMVRTKLYR